MIDYSALELPHGIDAKRLLDAIAAVETAGGANNWPNVEPAWLPAGVAVTVEGRVLRGRSSNPIVLKRYRAHGIGSAASWGPWQILYHTAADLGYPGRPWALHDADVSAPWVMRQIARIVARGAVTVGDIADSWNSGTHRDANRVPEYRAKVEAAYEGKA